MSLVIRIKTMPRRTKQLAALGLAAVVVLAAVLATRGARSEPEAPRGQARPSQAGGTEGMEGSAGIVRLTPDQIRSFGVTFATVERRLLEDEIRTVGVVAFNETRVASVAPKVAGFAERLYADFTGQPVRRGQPLVEVYSSELIAAQEELLLAARLQENLGASGVPGMPEGGANLVRAARQRLRLWDVSDAQIDEVLRTGRARRTLTLYAPVGGTIVEKNVVLGQAFEPGQALYTIADLATVWVEAEIREMDAALISVGDPASVELTAFPGRPISGLVDYVYPTLQAPARTLKARIALPNPDGRVKPGMYATVLLRAPGRAALTVPVAALLRTGERQLVFVDAGNGELMPQEVEIARVAGDFAEVLAGLEPGQRVVTSAQFLLDSESNLGEVMRSMIGSTGTSDMGSVGGMESGGADMKGMPMPAPRD